MAVASHGWDPAVSLGDVVSAWAAQQSIPVRKICLVHESDDDFLADDIVWDDVGSLAKKWGAAFSLEISIPSRELVRDCALHL